jgi:RNA polymerase sigma factor (sigma-70 family)
MRNLLGVSVLLIRRRHNGGVIATRLSESVKTLHPVGARRPYQVRMRQTSPPMQIAPAPDDDTLMAAYAHGDAAAFELLYARHRAGLYRFVRRLLGTALAAQTDEVFQDTWLRVVKARATWAPQGASFRTWLFTLAHHRVIDLLRRSGREVSIDAFESSGQEPWEPEALAGTGKRRAAQRRTRVLAPRRRTFADVPGTTAFATTQRFPAAPRRRPGTRRSGHGARSRLRDREDAAALRDEEAARLHGRLPGTGAGERQR